MQDLDTFIARSVLPSVLFEISSGKLQCDNSKFFHATSSKYFVYTVCAYEISNCGADLVFSTENHRNAVRAHEAEASSDEDQGVFQVCHGQCICSLARRC